MAITETDLASERRKYPRWNIDLPVKYLTKASFRKYGRTANASEGGLLVHLPEEMKVGQDLTLQLFFVSGSELNTLEATVQVVWKGVHVKRDWTWDYRTGVSFKHISPGDMTKLKDFLVSLAQKETYTS